MTRLSRMRSHVLPWLTHSPTGTWPTAPSASGADLWNATRSCAAEIVWRSIGRSKSIHVKPGVRWRRREGRWANPPARKSLHKPRPKDAVSDLYRGSSRDSLQVRLQFLVVHDLANGVAVEVNRDPSLEGRFLAADPEVVDVVPPFLVKRIVDHRRAQQESHLVAGHSDLYLVEVGLL